MVRGSCLVKRRFWLLHNFPQTHLEANPHVAPACHWKSMTVLTFGPQSLHPKIRLSNLWTTHSREPTLGNVTHFTKMQALSWEAF